MRETDNKEMSKLYILLQGGKYHRTEINQGSKIGIVARGCIFGRVGSEGLIEKLTFEQRLQRDERAASHVDSMEKNVSNRKEQIQRP